MPQKHILNCAIANRRYAGLSIKINSKSCPVERGFPRMPRRVSELSAGLARRGDAWMRRVDEGAGSPFRQPPTKARNAGSKRHPGRLFFGYFLLATHKFAWSEFEQPTGWPAGRKPWTVFVAKVSRLSVREPTLNSAFASATHYFCKTSNSLREPLINSVFQEKQQHKSLI